MELVEDSVARAEDDAAGTVDHLTELMRCHPHPVLRHEAAFMLGSLRARGLAPDDIALSLCAAALDDRSMLVRHEAAEALWNFDAEEVAGTLHRLSEHPDNDIAVTAELSLRRRWRRLNKENSRTLTPK